MLSMIATNEYEMKGLLLGISMAQEKKDYDILAAEISMSIFGNEITKTDIGIECDIDEHINEAVRKMFEEGDFNPILHIITLIISSETYKNNYLLFDIDLI